MSSGMPSIVKTKLLGCVRPLSDDNSDVTLILQEESGKIYKFPADPRVLRRSSRVFAQLLREDAATNGRRTVNVTNINPHVLKHLLQFIHTGEHEITSVQDAIELLKASLEFQVLSVIDECQKMLVFKMNLSNVCQFYDLARDDQFLRHLDDSAKDLILRAIPLLIRTSSFDSLSLDLKRSLLSNDHLCVESEMWLRETLASLNLLHAQCLSTAGPVCDTCLSSVVRRSMAASPEGRQQTQRKWDPSSAPSVLKYCERWQLGTSEMNDWNSWRCRKFSKTKEKPFVTFAANRAIYLYGYSLAVLDTSKVRDFRLSIFKKDDETVRIGNDHDNVVTSWNCVRRERILDSSFVRLTFELHHPLLMPIGAHCSLFYSSGKCSSFLPIVNLSQKRFYLDCAVVTILSEKVFGFECAFLYSAVS